MNISETISKTIATGVPPMELTYKAIRDCYDNKIKAYRTELVVNSIELGRITASEFSPVSDKHEIGIRLCERTIVKAFKNAEIFNSLDRHPAWISVYCPAEYAEQTDFYDRLKSLVKKNKTCDINLCLEFSEELLLSKADVKKAVMDMKLLGVKSMIRSGKEGTFPYFRLSEIPVDYILLDKAVTDKVWDRAKPDMFSSLVRYLQSVNVGIIAESNANIDELNTLNRLECKGYISSAEQWITPEEAAEQKEGNG